ncbi:MAG: coenzyme F420-0:L-glutamate ligase [Patescibacteria group bacterium]|nr:coenzyme F420-0:L-glutamate ligase [Patescibacteria group bacterium]MDE2589660.1 coenzyme F420-0:L-glutamate ligase [Patescibacteria group bacterium]
MIVTPIKTHKITTKDTSICAILDTYITRLEEKTIIAVTSKIVSLTEGRVAPMTADKKLLIKQESAFFLPSTSSKYDVQFTIKNNILAASAGIDESNADNQYVLWPENPQQSANIVRQHLSQKFGVSKVGVIITDSKTTPLRWGVTGISLAHSGFVALKDYIGTEDLFGRKFHYEKLNIADTLASSAIVVMGEGAEQTPLACITDIPHITFQDRNPTADEINSLIIQPQDDLYEPLLTSVTWEKGEK